MIGARIALPVCSRAAMLWRCPACRSRKLPDGEVALYRWTKRRSACRAIRAADGIGTVAGDFCGYCHRARLDSANVLSRSALGVRSRSDYTRLRQSLNVAQPTYRSKVPSSAVRVSGVVVGPAAAIADLPVRLLASSNELLGFGGEAALTNTDTAGRFTLAQVPRGDYTVLVGRAVNEIQVINQSQSGSRLEPTPISANPFLNNMSGARISGQPGIYLQSDSMSGDDVTGRMSISVGPDAIDGLVVPTRAGVTISGHALFDGADAPAAGHATSSFGPSFGPLIRLDPADGDTTRTMEVSHPEEETCAKPPGPEFSIENVVPGHYRLTDQGTGGNGDYRLVGATWHDQDLFATPLDVTGQGPVTDIVVYLSSKHNSISGSLRVAGGQTLSAGAVLIFPQDRNRWNEPGISAPQFRSVDVLTDTRRVHGY